MIFFSIRPRTVKRVKAGFKTIFLSFQAKNRKMSQNGLQGNIFQVREFYGKLDSNSGM
jgi:hypothetical protein